MMTVFLNVHIYAFEIYIHLLIKRDTSGFHDDERFDNKWWILFSGDKGEHFMKSLGNNKFKEVWLSGQCAYLLHVRSSRLCREHEKGLAPIPFSSQSNV